jgi:hypothetical protein
MPRAFTYPVDFRQRDLEYLFNSIVNGDSLAMIGVGTVGKSHLVQHVTERTDVQDHFLSSAEASIQSRHLFCVRVDPNALLEPSTSFPPSWRGIELMFRSMCDAVRLREGEMARDEGGLYRRVLDRYALITRADNFGPQMAYRILETTIDELHWSLLGQVQPPQVLRWVFVLDEFQRLVEEMPDHFFLNLRALRDRLRYELVFVAVARQEVEHLFPAERRLRVEPFIELFQRPLYLGPYQTPADRQTLMRFLTDRYLGIYADLPDAFHERFFRLTGGHAGLARTCFKIGSVFQRTDEDEAIIAMLLREPEIVRECQIILESFTKDERDLLRAVARGRAPATDNPGYVEPLNRLVRKHILAWEGRAVRLMPPILEVYLRQ